jgi:hypothetical protein
MHGLQVCSPFSLVDNAQACFFSTFIIFTIYISCGDVLCVALMLTYSNALRSFQAFRANVLNTVDEDTWLKASNIFSWALFQQVSIGLFSNDWLIEIV